MDHNKSASDLCDLVGWLQEQRRDFEHPIEDIQALMMPNKQEITTTIDRSASRTPPSYDSTAANAADAMINHLIGSVLPPTADFIRLENLVGEASPEDRADFDSAGEKLMQILDHSNFYEAAGQSLKDMWVIGNTTFYHEERLPTAFDELFPGTGFSGMSFEAVQFADMWRHIDRQGNILVSAKRFRLTGLEAQEFFGDDWVGGLDDFESGEIYHIFKRNEGRWKMWWLYKTDEKVISEADGLLVNPYTSSTLERIGNDQYGVGKGHICRSTAAGMNESKRLTLNVVGRILDQPLVMENDTIIRAERSGGSRIIMRPGSTVTPFHLAPKLDLAAVDAVFRLDAMQVERAFMSDILLDPASQPRSAEESKLRNARIQARQAGATQVVKRWLSSIIANLVTDLVQIGVLDELRGKGPIKPVFSSPFFLAQRAGVIQKVVDYIQLKVAIANATQNPEVLDDVDFDGLTSFLKKNADIPESIHRTQSAVRQSRESRTDMEAQQLAIEQVQALSGITPSLASAPGGTIPEEG